jgi:hypothetical protein
MELPEDVATVVLEVMEQQMGAERPEGSVFGPPVDISEDASVQDRLIAFSGRTP